jgi:hypothetical protein
MIRILGITLLIFSISRLTGQTQNEIEIYKGAVREYEAAKKMIKEGLVQSSANDANGLDGVVSNENVRVRGRRQLEAGQQLAASAEQKIKAFNQRQESLRGILANKYRVLELESSDGRRSTFGIESISPPIVSIVRQDLGVITVPFDKFSTDSQSTLQKMADPKLSFESGTTYGGHFFPIAYLAKPKINEKKSFKTNDLPQFSLITQVIQDENNLAVAADLEITISSDWKPIRTTTKKVRVKLANDQKSQFIETPFDFIDEQLSGLNGNDVHEIQVETKYGQNQTYTTRLKIYGHGINDLPLYIQEADGKILDTKYLAASYVDETLPEFEEIKRIALEKKLVESFGGDTDDLDQTKKELFAVWHYLADKGVKYSSATETGNIGGSYASQRVRFPSEIKTSGQANCIDGSIYIASFAFNVGLDPILIVRPGHVYLAIRNHAKKHVLLETTAIGNISIDEKMSEGEKLSLIRANFDEAQLIAKKTLNKDSNLLDRAFTITRYYPGAVDINSLVRKFQFIDVREIRESGIPIVRPSNLSQ